MNVNQTRMAADRGRFCRGAAYCARCGIAPVEQCTTRRGRWCSGESRIVAKVVCRAQHAAPLRSRFWMGDRLPGI
jgi:hypothetical protein